jgi:hypothetical protein
VSAGARPLSRRYALLTRQSGRAGDPLLPPARPCSSDPRHVSGAPELEVIMTALADMPTATAVTDPVTAVRHFHVCESQAGCLPETEPYVTDDAPLALDALAHLLTDWAETREPDDSDATHTEAVAEIYCVCPQRGHSAEHHDALARLEQGQNICETTGLRVFEIAVCTERDCLKYCPADDCRTVTDVTEIDTRCWCCGAHYVPWDACPWLA